MAGRKCVGCESTEEFVHMFKVNIYDAELDAWVDGIHCNACVANIMTEDPEVVWSLEAI